MNDDTELTKQVMLAIYGALRAEQGPWEVAEAAIATVRAYDREQRAKIDASLAPKHDPDADKECPSALVYPPRPTGGLTQFKRD